MGNVIGHFLNFSNQYLDAIKHFVEGSCKQIYLVIRTFYRDPVLRAPADIFLAVLVTASTPDTALFAINQPAPAAKISRKAMVKIRMTQMRRESANSFHGLADLNGYTGSEHCIRMRTLSCGQVSRSSQPHSWFRGVTA
jgi:hypothetical protein